MLLPPRLEWFHVSTKEYGFVFNNHLSPFMVILGMLYYHLTTLVQFTVFPASCCFKQTNWNSRPVLRNGFVI